MEYAKIRFQLTILRSSPESVKGRYEMGHQRCQENWEGNLFYWPEERVEQEKNKVRMWIKRNGVDNMRCAINGPRESEEPSIEGGSYELLCEALSVS
jgi:hypothetical protein